MRDSGNVGPSAPHFADAIVTLMQDSVQLETSITRHVQTTSLNSVKYYAARGFESTLEDVAI